MRTLTVQAYEDQSRPEGGHAVIIVHGLELDGSESSDKQLSFRLRPIDASGDGSGAAAWVDSGRGDFGTRRTEQGVELSIGPDIADNEQLLPGTVIEIEFPESGARGEFLWPNIAPVLRPKRRNIVLNRARRPKGEGEPVVGNGVLAGDVKSEAVAPPAPAQSAPAQSAPVPSAPVPSAPVQAAAEPSAPPPAPVEAPQSSRSEPPPPREAETRPAARTGAATSLPDALAALEAVVAAAQSTKEDDLMPSSRHSASPEDGKAARPAAGAQVSDTAAITAGESWYESARGSHRMASEPAPSRRPQKAGTSLAATGGILLAALAGIYMLSRDPGGRHVETPAAAGPTAAAPVAAPPMPASAPSFAAPAVPAPAAAAGKGVREPSLFDVLAAGTVSPRGVNAAGVDGAKALENANALLQGPSRDLEEGAFWLRRFLQSSLSDERTMRVLTQLGSAYAEPQGRAPDYVKARLLWEIASAAGDPVAMCFIGLMHENGLGTTLDKKVALQWYERSKKAGGCPQVDDMIVRTRQ